MRFKSLITKNGTKDKLLMPVIILVVGCLGLYFLTGSHAASPFASLSADQGSLTCGATSGADSTASDGNKVTFNACDSGGGGGSTNPACTGTTRYTSTTAAASAVASASAGTVICMAAGSYGSITLTGSHGSGYNAVTLEPDPSQDPAVAGKVTFSSIQINGTGITVQNFYSTGGITVNSSGGYDTINHNDVTDSPGNYGITVNGNTSSPVNNVTINGNRIHDLAGTAGSLFSAPTPTDPNNMKCNYGGDGDALRLGGWANVVITNNEETGIEEINGTVIETDGVNCEGHTDCLQSFNNQVSTSHDLTFENNYVHDNQCEGPPFLKDGNISGSVIVADNLDVRSQNRGLSDTALFLVENTSGVIVRNNTYLGNGSSLQGSGTAIADHNVFGQFNTAGYTFTSENHNIYTDGNQWSFTVNSTDIPPPSAAYGTKYTPTYKCGSNCGNGTSAGDDYELTAPVTTTAGCMPTPVKTTTAQSDSCIGIDWNPVNQHYGPTANP